MIRVLTAILGAGLTVLIILAALEAPMWASFGRITQDLWGWVALADLYLGFIFLAFIIALVERNAIAAVLWIVPLFFLGNIWSALWFVLRWPEVVRRLKSDV